MKFKYKKDAIANSEKGSSFIMMIVMISVIITIGFAFLFMVLTMFKLGKIYQASENLYFETVRGGQVISEHLTKRVNDFIATNNGINFNNISDAEFVQVTANIYSYYSTEINAGLSPAANRTITGFRNKVRSMLRNSGSTLTGSNKTNAKDAIKDIYIKTQIRDLLNTTNDNTILDSGSLMTYLQPVAGTKPIPNIVNANDATKYDFYLDTATITKNDSTDTGTWLTNFCSCTSDANYNVANGLIYGTGNYGKVDYTLKASNTVLNIQKEVKFTFEVASVPFAASSINNNTYSASSYTNSKFDKLLAAYGELKISGGKNVTLNGDIYSYGNLPTDMTANIIDPNNFKGITIDGGGTLVNPREVNITGTAVTRGYIKAAADYLNLSIGKYAVCDTLNATDSAKRNINITIGPSTGADFARFTDPPYNTIVSQTENYLSTFDDIRVDSPNSNVTVHGNYYGLNAGSSTGVNKSSSLILNSTTGTISIDGDALIGGVAFVSNIYRSISGNNYAFKTGESGAVGHNFKVYGYNFNAVDAAVRPDSGSTPPYGINQSGNSITMGFPVWTVKNISGTSQIVLLDPDPNDPGSEAKTSNLKSHFYHYVKLKESQGDILFDYEPIKAGITLDESKTHYAPGIVCANNKYFWGHGATPDTTNFPVFPNRYTFSDYQSYSSDAANPDSKKSKAIRDISYIKVYDDTASNPNSGESKETEYTDSGATGKLIDISSYITRTDSNYFYYIRKNNTAITIGGAGSDILSNNINNHTGIIYTKGDITIDPTANFTFNGVIIANNIYINAEDGSVTLNHNLTDINSMYNSTITGIEDVKKFFGPGNIASLTGTSQSYSPAARFVRMINKIQTN
ncbi:MAG: hypothetical protein ACM3UU_11040 [Ignavibacteriales bacterium]